MSAENSGSRSRSGGGNAIALAIRNRALAATAFWLCRFVQRICISRFGRVVAYYTVGRQCGICTRRAFLGAYTRPFFTPALLGTIAAKWMPMRSSIIRATCGIGIAPSSRFSRLQSAWRRRVQSFCSGTHRQNCIVPPNNSMERTAVGRLSKIECHGSAVSHLSRSHY